jgi:hypothetical protein
MKMLSVDTKFLVRKSEQVPLHIAKLEQNQTVTIDQVPLSELSQVFYQQD